jgi:hypothetical protein
MAFNNIMKIFLPKDRVFYSLFEQVAEKVTLMGKLLEEFVYEADDDKRLATHPPDFSGTGQKFYHPV